MTTATSAPDGNDDYGLFALARKEAQRLGHCFIGSELLLVGILAHGENLAAASLLQHGLTFERAQSVVTRINGYGSGTESKEFYLTPVAKLVLELAWKEALRLRDKKLAPHHILLAILSYNSGVAARVLETTGINVEELPVTLNCLIAESRKEG